MYMVSNNSLNKSSKDPLNLSKNSLNKRSKNPLNSFTATPINNTLNQKCIFNKLTNAKSNNNIIVPIKNSRFQERTNKALPRIINIIALSYFK